MSTTTLSEPPASTAPAVASMSPIPPAAPEGAGKKRRKVVLGGALGVAVAAGLALYLVHASHYEETDDAYTTGHVHAVASRIAGTVLSVKVDDNDAVKAGQALVELDPRDFQVVVDKAQADYDRASADFDRVEALKGNVAISKQDYDQTKSAMQVAKATLDDAKNQLSYCTVATLTDGAVGNKTVQVGNRIAAGTVLMSVVEDCWVVANFKETQVGRMHRGQRVEVRIDAVPGRVFTGRIDSLSPGSGSIFALLPPENATGNFTKIVQRVPVKIVFDPESIDGYERRLVPGLSVVAEVDLKSNAASRENQ